MGRSTCWAYLVILGVTLSQIDISEACTCVRIHPQESFRQSDYVALLRVSKELVGNITYDEEIAYNVTVLQIFKATPEAESVLLGKAPLVWTAALENMCGELRLTPGKKWVIAGRMVGKKLRTTLCDLSVVWSEATRRQRHGFRKLYRRGKNCKVTWTSWAKKGAAYESANGTSCLWESAPGPTDCQEDYGVCRYNNGKAGKGKTCSWAPSKLYDECIRKHQLRRTH